MNWFKDKTWSKNYLWNIHESDDPTYVEDCGWYKCRDCEHLYQDWNRKDLVRGFNKKKHQAYKDWRKLEKMFPELDFVFYKGIDRTFTNQMHIRRLYGRNTYLWVSLIWNLLLTGIIVWKLF